MESPLEKIIFQKQDAPGLIKMESGLMFYKEKEAMLWLCIEYENRFETFLLLDDQDQPPYRNHLTSGVGRTLEQAREIAINKMEKEVFNKVH
ncbi:hypothetical protein [Cytobacillus praedii]|uniref:Uncharacterized protein n=1 Tax=Cytobacillus praedii TaxID=1742358 RepID=A0A4R1APK0_9BACI|nr:hypothetical protein [Cytobacillus praedii]TCJ01827.1 hypothetical protein E0Y62_22105 [Cytobacillus praedii]